MEEPDHDEAPAGSETARIDALEEKLKAVEQRETALFFRTSVTAKGTKTYSPTLGCVVLLILALVAFFWVVEIHTKERARNLNRTTRH